MPRKPGTQQSQQHQAQQRNTSKAREDTAFEKRLYHACKSIPEGKCCTYGTLAAALDSSARAVGQGMRRNPHAPVVPCHRVIASNLSLGGFNGSWGMETASVQRKLKMLMDEGVRFKASKVDAACMCSLAELLKAMQRTA